MSNGAGTGGTVVGVRRRALWRGALLVALLSCSCWNVDLSGVGGSSGSGGSGTAVGPVTGFGSVKTGGVEFTDNSATTVVDDEGRGLADLVEGMRVTVRGTIDADYRSGTASTVTIEREVRGPVDDNGVALDSRALRVLGQPVLVDPATVILDAFGAEIALADLRNQLDNGAYPGLEIHGAADDNGTVHATYIGQVQDNVADGDSVRLRGKIGAFVAGSSAFTIGNQQINYTGLPSGGRVDWPVTGLANGLVVDVQGYLDNVGGTGVVRTDRAGDRIAVLTPSLGDASDRVSLQGYVLSGTSASFTMSIPGGTATVTGAASISGDPFGTRKKVRVKGMLSGAAGTTVQASSVTVLPANQVVIEGVPEGVPTTGATMTVLAKSVETDEFTLFMDATGGARTGFGLGELTVSDTVRVVGWFDNTVAPGKVVAAKVERIDVSPADTYTLQGPVSSVASASVLPILGVNVVTDALHTDYFDRGAVALADQASFFARLAASGAGTVVQVRHGVFTAGSTRLDPPSTGPHMEVEIVTVNR
jgi:Domain of unknown function (DUF5666)